MLDLGSLPAVSHNAGLSESIIIAYSIHACPCDGCCLQPLVSSMAGPNLANILYYQSVPVRLQYTALIGALSTPAVTTGDHFSLNKAWGLACGGQPPPTNWTAFTHQSTVFLLTFYSMTG